MLRAGIVNLWSDNVCWQQILQYYKQSPSVPENKGTERMSAHMPSMQQKHVAGLNLDLITFIIQAGLCIMHPEELERY